MHPAVACMQSSVLRCAATLLALGVPDAVLSVGGLSSQCVSVASPGEGAAAAALAFRCRAAGVV